MDWQALEMLIRSDPGGRGLTLFRDAGELLAYGGLEGAARSLAERGVCVAIATGFVILAHDPPAAETDGPPGALYLARALEAVGIETVLISDAYGVPLLRAGLDQWRLERTELLEFPLGDGAGGADGWIEAFLASSRGQRLSHLAAVERVGPSHTPASLAAQVRHGPPPRDAFERDVPSADRDRCHNMRGLVIDEHTAPIHRLFEAVAARRPEIETVAVADGGNEIGMGCIPWEILQQAIARGPAGAIACRIPVKRLVLAGISNWGAYALGAAVAVLRKRSDLIRLWDIASHRRLIETMVFEAGAVDGVTGLQQPSVDGIALEPYLAVLAAIQEEALRDA